MADFQIKPPSKNPELLDTFVTQNLNHFSLLQLSYLLLAKETLSTQTQELLLTRLEQLADETLTQEISERLALSVNSINLDPEMTLNQMVDTAENANLVEILTENFELRSNVKLHKNQLVCDGQLKANLVVEVTDKNQRFVIEVVETEMAHFTNKAGDRELR